ncbi:unnamed protein product [Linum trigynum]|uniref:Uncharacterized protein n=1 Tax=Linum trigynum TaxID=586398 RepID=A0AAV2GT63_9ROSI
MLSSPMARAQAGRPSDTAPSLAIPAVLIASPVVKASTAEGTQRITISDNEGSTGKKTPLPFTYVGTVIGVKSSTIPQPAPSNGSQWGSTI